MLQLFEIQTIERQFKIECEKFTEDSNVNKTTTHTTQNLMPVPKLLGNQSLEEADPELFDLIEQEKSRQFRGLELIASEVTLEH